MRKIRFKQFKKLKEKVKKFKDELYEDSDLRFLDQDEIDLNIVKSFEDEEMFLNLGYVQLSNIIEFCRDRPMNDRRLIKMACLPKEANYNLFEIFTRKFEKLGKNTVNSTMDLWRRRSNNDPFLHRIDKNQKRIPIATQEKLMNFILENSQFNPGKKSLKSIKAKKITNEATLIFLRKHCIRSMKNGEEIFQHPSMVLKTRDLKDVYKNALNYSDFENISYYNFKQMVLFFVDEKPPKWSSQCFW